MKNKIKYLLSIFAVIIFLLILINFLNPKQIQKSPDLPEFIFIDLSEEQQIELNKIIKTIPNDYIIGIKTITFTSNQSACEEVGKSSCNGYYWDGDILVEFNSFDKLREDIKITKVILCHEIMHHHFKDIKNTKDYSDPSHRVIQDLAKKGVCYG